MRKLTFFLFVLAFSQILSFAQSPTQGTLYAAMKNGQKAELLLQSTKVKADISGFVARVTVTQEFQNNLPTTADAVYGFPLEQNSVVDEMTITIGERTIRGKVLTRDDARKALEAVKSDGKTAALFDLQSSGVFTQSVANIRPGSKIVVVISYVENLRFENGEFEFVFPLTNGPQLSQVVSKDTPPVIAKTDDTRSGRDISLEINLDAGLPVNRLYSKTHPIDSVKIDADSAKIVLGGDKVVPNKDFVLRYDVTGKRITDSLLVTRPKDNGYFSLLLAPPDITTKTAFTPKEIVFVLDTSGSMTGFPIEAAIKAINLSLDGLNPGDTFNIITFAGDSSVFADAPVPATPDNLATARSFLKQPTGGGSDMMKAFRAAIKPSESKKRLRIVCFMTDGFVSNESEILDEIKKYPKTRIFGFGIGMSVNRQLLDKMAAAGNGEVVYLESRDDGSAAAQRFSERIKTPVLTDISIDWRGLSASDIYVKTPLDFFSAKPLVFVGRYSGHERIAATLRGKIRGKPFSRRIDVDFTKREAQNRLTAMLWARKQFESLSRQLADTNDVNLKKRLVEQINALCLEFRLITPFTQFVAFEEKIVTENGVSKRVDVPVSKQEMSARLKPLEIVTGPRRAQPVASKSNVGAVLPEILKRLAAHQKTMKSLKADIEITFLAAQFNELSISKGRLLYVRDSAVRIDMTKPRVETISIVKNDMVLYLPQTNTAIVRKLNDDMVFALDFFRNGFDRAALIRDYNVAYTGTEKLNEKEPAWVLTLKPKENSLFSSVRLLVDGNGMPRKFTFLLPNGDTNTIELKSPVKNTTIDGAAFRVALPKSVKIIKG